PPLTSLRTGVPMGLEWIVSKCLAKDPNERYQACADLIVDLRSGGWILVYGRRKTGKTFLVSRFLDHDSYYFVKRDRTVILNNDWKMINMETMLELMKRDLHDEKTVVIDEFHRLGSDFLDLLHSLEMRGKLVLISSTLHLSREIISGSSPLLGKVSELKVPIISYLTLLRGDPGKGKKYYEMQAFRQEPLVIALGYRNPVDAVKGSILTVPALIGEIFSEEDRKLSSTYEGILRSVAVGRSTSGEIASYLFSRKIIKKDDPSLVQQYILNLLDIGILKRTQVFNRNRYVYNHTSPMAWAFYSLDERYNISDRDLSSIELGRLLEEILPRIMETVIRTSISERTGTIDFVDHSPHDEIDGFFVRFRKPVAVMEVKWKVKIGRREASRIREKLMSHDADRRILIVPDRKMIEIEGVEVLEPSDILDLEIQ
ncbi:MAG: AAA family ATPase, partial [Thermoplasmatota archaeon]